MQLASKFKLFMTNLKKYLPHLAISTLIMIALLIGIQYVSNRSNNYTTISSKAQTSTYISTGASDEPLSEQTLQLLQLANQLQTRLPVSGSGFSIKFDYFQDKFLVSLSTPYDISKANFKNWLISNGFSTLPQDYFYLELAPASAPTPTTRPPIAPTRPPIGIPTPPTSAY